MEENALPAGSISLEDEPAIVGLGQPETPEPEPVAADDDTVPDGTIEGTGGVQFAPVKAVIAERTLRKEAQKALASKDAEIAALTTKAQHLDAIQNEWNQLSPVLEKVRRGEFVPRQAEPAKAQLALSPEDAVEYAKDLDLYKPDGTPDVDRAQRLAGRQAALAAKSAEAAIAPFQANDAQRTSAAMKQQVASYKDANGFTVDSGILAEIWAAVPPELSARPEVAGILYQMALGQTLAAGKYQGTKPPGPPPVVPTESLGSRGGVVKDLDVFGQKFAKAADIKPSEFAKASGRYVPGQTNSLED